MKLPQVLRLTQRGAGIQEASHQIDAAEMVSLVQLLGPRGQVPCPPPTSATPGVVNVPSDDGSVFVVDLAKVGETDFAAFYCTWDSAKRNAGFASALAGQRLTTLISLLASAGHSSLSTLSKDAAIAKIVADPKLLYKALAGLARGLTYELGRALSLPCTDGRSMLYFQGQTVSTSVRRLDFWSLSWSVPSHSVHGYGSHQTKCLELTTRSQPDELSAVPAEAEISLSYRPAQRPELVLGGASAALDGLSIKQIAEQHGVRASTTRDETIKRVIAKYHDPELARCLDGQRVYVSFTTPLLVGKPLTAAELFALSSHLRFTTSAENIFEGFVEVQGERSDFQEYFRAKPRCWAVLADVEIS